MPISELIDKQDTFELVRDEIAAILATEVASQMALAVTAGKDPDEWKLRVFSERSNPWEQMLNDQTDRSPIVNVWFDSTSFNPASSNIVERQTAEGVFNIDCYGFGFSADDGGGHIAGDKEAAFEAHRALRLVRNILMAAEYTYLNLRGLVWNRWPQSITVEQPDIGERLTPKTSGARLALRVVFNELSPQVPSETLELVSASVKRQETGEVVVETDYVYPLQDPCIADPIPNRSMEFASSKFLDMSDANFGAFDRAKFAISLWYKLFTTGSSRYMWVQGDTASNISFQLRFGATDKLEAFALDAPSSIDGQLTSTATFTDTANWHHILYHFDSANATPGDRMRLWHDGVEITAFDTDNNPTAPIQDSASSVVIGSDSAGVGNFFNGKLYQAAFFSGSLPDISEVFDAGSAKDITGLAGLHGLLNTNDIDALEDDFVLPTDWANNGGVSKDNDIP